MINAIILVPEITKGMKSVGSKSLLKIKHNKYIIQHQIEQLYNIARNIRITIATGFDHDKMVKATERYNNITVLHNPDYQTTNFGKCMELYLKQSPEINNLLIISSGILFKPHTLMLQHLKKTSKLFMLDKPKNNFDIGCNNSESVEYLFYDLPTRWSECVYLNGEAMKNLYQLLLNASINQLYVFEIINKLISRNITFEPCVVPKNNFLKISTIKDVNRARVFV